MRIPIAARTCAWVIVTALPGSAAARADDIVIALQVSQGEKKAATKLTYIHPTKKKQPPRVVFKAASGKPLRVTWKVSNTSKTSTYKNVLVHYFVAPEKKAGQPKVPPLGKKDVEHEGAVTLDFKAGDKAKGEFTATIGRAGSYLLRVETIGLTGRAGHEFHAALDIVLK
jgi:hypothetical protein